MSDDEFEVVLAEALDAFYRAERERKRNAEQRIHAHAHVVADRLTEELLTPEQRAAGLHLAWEAG